MSATVPLGRPAGWPLMRMQWLHLLFAHWPVSVEQLRPLIPPALEIDTFDGTAWIGLVPFTMRDVNLAPLPLGSWRGLTAFHECNVRTYVTCQGEPGVWFFSLDAASRLGVWGARTFFHLPYFNARIALHRDEDRITYAVDRTDTPRGHVRCVWRAGQPLSSSQPGDLPYFLTERYAMYAADDWGHVYRGPIWHKPWTLREAALDELDESLIAAAGVKVSGPPTTLHHVDFIDTRAWRMHRLKVDGHGSETGC